MVAARIAGQQHPLATAGHHEHDRGQVEHGLVEKGRELGQRQCLHALAPLLAQRGDLLRVRSDHGDRQATGEFRRVSGLDDSAAEGAVGREPEHSGDIRELVASCDRAQDRR